MGRTFTTAEAAKKVGISRQTLHTWINRRLVAAPKPVKFGRSSFRFWTEEDVDRLKDFKGTLKRGPKEKTR